MKSVTIQKLSILIVILVSIASCKQQNDGQTDKIVSVISPDSLMNAWNVAWNSTDSITISKMLTDKSFVVFSNKKKLSGTDSIMTKWVNKNLPQIANLKTEKISSSATSEMAYYYGNYSLDITKNDSVVGSDIGCFTAIWKLQSDKSWKMELMFFGEVAKE